MNRPVTHEDALEKAVNSLPDTPEGIAALLIRERVKGWPLDAKRCPLAVYLTQVTGKEVTIGTAKVWHAPGEGLPLTPAMSEFTRRFDLDNEMPGRGELLDPLI